MVDASNGENAMQLRWSFGFNKDILGGVHNLSDGQGRCAVFYVSAHSGVIYDYAERSQRLLQGHVNPISCCCVSDDKKWIATADSGPDSMIVIWDSLTGTPIKTIFNPHPNGVVAIDMSPDAMFLATLSHVPEEGEQQQEIALWEWTVEREDGPLYTASVVGPDVQTCVRFNPADIREVVTNGKRRVFFWSWEQHEFTYYSPPISQRDFRQAISDFTVSLFLPDTSQAITATMDGDVVLWDKSLVGQSGGGGGGGGGDGGTASDNSEEKRAVKVIRLASGPLWYVGHVGRFLVLAGDDGAVRFYDYQFRIEAWFEDLDAGPITSVSFAAGGGGGGGGDDQAGIGSSFIVPDFVVGTGRAFIVGVESRLFQELTAEARRGTLLVQGLDDEVHGLDAHKFLPHLAVACYSGNLQLWNYEEHRLLMVRAFDPAKLRPHCLSFDPTGRFLTVGFTSGAVKVLNADTLDDLFTFRPGYGGGPGSYGCITEARFSSNGEFMATADSSRHVALWRYMVDEEAQVDSAVKLEDSWQADGEGDDQPPPEPEKVWLYIGRYRSHTKPITGLEFGVSEDGQPLLVSVGEDNMLVDYDLALSSVGNGVVLRGQRAQIEQVATPTTCIWHPLLPGETEDRIITANSSYKFKQWNADNKTCRRTSLGPTYGGPLNRLLSLPRTPQYGAESDIAEPSEYVVYSTHEKVIGLTKLPLDGNPNKSMGLIAHPGELSGLAVSGDGRHVVTAGGKDLTVNLWSVKTDVLDAMEAAGGRGIEPFIGMLEGGHGGEFYEEIVEYFYYAQLRSQGEQTTATRETSGLVPLVEIPNLIRALGHYPTEKEVQDMCSEVKYSRFTQTGETVEYVDLHGFIQIYVNHRPVFGVGKAQIEDAFRALGCDIDTGNLPWGQLVEQLQIDGEGISPEDLTNCLTALTGEDAAGQPRPEQELTSADFSDQILGFDDYDAEEEEEAAVGQQGVAVD